MFEILIIISSRKIESNITLKYLNNQYSFVTKLILDFLLIEEIKIILFEGVWKELFYLKHNIQSDCQILELILVYSLLFNWNFFWLFFKPFNKN